MIGCVTGKDRGELSPLQVKHINRNKRRYIQAFIAARIAKQTHGDDSHEAIQARRKRNDLSYQLAEYLGWDAVDALTENLIK